MGENDVALDLGLDLRRQVTLPCIALAEELASIRRSLAASERMRRPAFCSSSRPAAAPDTESAGSSIAADTASGLVSIEVDRDFKALILEVESALAAGRAAQAFIRANDMGQ